MTATADNRSDRPCVICLGNGYVDDPTDGESKDCPACGFAAGMDDDTQE